MTGEILVTGATGYIGGRLVPRLLAEGYVVRCLARDSSRLDGRAWQGAKIVQADLLEPATLPSAMEGVEVAYYLVHSMGAGEHTFADRDREAASNFAQAARKAGVKRIIYLGGLGQQTTGTLSAHLRSRQEIGDILRAGSSGPPIHDAVPVTEFRAAIVVGSGSMSFEMIRALTERLPVMICPRWVNTLCQPISIRDVLLYLAAALQEERSTGQIIEIGGANVLTYRQMMLGYARVRGLRRWLISVPVLTPRLSSLWVNLVTPIPTAYARPLIEGLISPVVVTNDCAQQLFPNIRPMGYHRAVRIALEKIDLNMVETNWAGSLQSSAYAHPSTTQLHSEQGMIIERRERTVLASPHEVYQVLTSIGGRNGWYYANWLWKIRALLDRLMGGVGMRRGRRNPIGLVAGDALDWWRVEAVEREKLILLRAEMRLPGRGWLEFRIEPLTPATSGSPASAVRTRLQQTAWFQPRGLAGLLYWYLLYPIHRIIFAGMVREVAHRAENRVPVHAERVR